MWEAGDMNTVDRKAYDAVTAYAEEYRETMIAELRELCRIPSVSVPDSGFDSDGGKTRLPFGKEVEKALRKVKEIAARYGVSCTVKSGFGYATAEIDGKGGNGSIGIFSHCDVVPANADEWTMTEPFEPRIDGGFLYCRGCDDNKAAAIEALHIAHMARLGILPLKNKLICYFGGSEECGMDDLKTFCAHETLPTLCLVPDNGSPLSLGEKGIARFDFRAQKEFSQIIAFDGGTVVNAVIGTHTAKMRDADGALYRELLRLVKDDPSYEISTEISPISPDSSDSLTTVVCHGVSAHAAHPQNGCNAAVKNARLLCRCESLDKSDREILARTVALFEDPLGSGVGIFGSDEHFGNNTFVLGVTAVEKATLVGKIDCRFGKTLPSDILVCKVREAVGAAGFSVEVCEMKDCYEANLPTRLLTAFLDTYHVISFPDAQPFYSAGGTYARYLPCGISFSPFDWYDLPAIKDTLPPGRGGAHQADEHIGIDSFIRGTITTAKLLAALDDVL